MQQPTQSLNNKRGGARKGAGRKPMDVSKITISVPTEQLTKLDENKITNRSEAYSNAMKEWLKNSTGGNLEANQ